MSRNMQRGTEFETWIVEYLNERFGCRMIERRARHGVKDRGDVSGVHCHAGRVVIEAKNHAKLALGTWITEAGIEKGNDDAAVGVVIHKRRGKGRQSMGEQYVTLTLEDFVTLLGAPKEEQA